MSLHERFGGLRWSLIVLVLAGGATGCMNAPETTLERLTEASKLTADLAVQFTKAGDAANRAVMADMDEASVAFAREAEQATQAVQTDIDTLGPILAGLGYSNETSLLGEFSHRFAEYRTLDRSILELAVENTNLKAQRLSYGPAQEAADAFRDALERVVPAGTSENSWRVRALVATAVAAVRDIQVLQAPHIAESDDADATVMEKRMSTSEAAARTSVETLSALVGAGARTQLMAATAALERFTALNSQILALSRRNTNVRSLALSLGQKRMMTAACEDALHALQDALSKRGFRATR